MLICEFSFQSGGLARLSSGVARHNCPGIRVFVRFLCCCSLDSNAVLTRNVVQVLTSDTVFSAPMTETYAMLGADPKETTTLELYLQEYYAQILKKLKDLKASSKQGDYYL